MGAFIIAGVVLIVGIILLIVIVIGKVTDTGEFLCVILLVLCAGIFIASVGIGLTMTITAKEEVLTYNKNCQMIEEVIANGEEYDNVSISKTIIEYNSWLSQAKADKELFGIFSKYYFEDIENLKYLSRLRG